MFLAADAAARLGHEGRDKVHSCWRTFTQKELCGGISMKALLLKGADC